MHNISSKTKKLYTHVTDMFILEFEKAESSWNATTESYRNRDAENEIFKDSLTNLECLVS